MKLIERDIEIMTSIYNLRFVSTRHIHILHGYNGKYGQDVTRRKLKQLEDIGLLKSYRPNIYEPKIFYLSKAGAEEVAIYNGLESVKTYQRSDKSAHQVMISDIYVALRQSDIGKLRRFTLSQRVIDRLYTDAFIQYRIGDANKLLFLEADRATERINVIIDKLDAYKEAKEGGEWQRKFGIFPEIAFVTTSDTRKRSLLRLKERYDLRMRVLTLEEVDVNAAEILV